MFFAFFCERVKRIFEKQTNTKTFHSAITIQSGADDIPQWIPTGWYPFILVLYTVTQLLFPLRTRVPMWEAIWQVITAPLHSPSFFHGYVGDVFTSMVKVFQDVAWTVCWVAHGEFTAYENLKDEANFQWVNAVWYKHVLIPIICLFPLLIRFNQCLRRYIDTGEESLSLSVIERNCLFFNSILMSLYLRGPISSFGQCGKVCTIPNCHVVWYIPSSIYGINKQRQF